MARAPPSPGATIDYRFRQRFSVAAEAAYEWATDFAEDDWERVGLDGRRSVRWLSPSLVQLTDTIADGSAHPLAKTRLVHLYPRSRTWVSTHVGGPRLHSQFRYAIRPLGRGRSELEFLGRELRWDRRYPDAEVARLAVELRDEDAGLWRTFARVMARDLAPGGRATD